MTDPVANDPVPTETTPEPDEGTLMERWGEVTLYFHRGAWAGTSQQFVSTNISIGRGPGMDLELPDSSVSHVHAEIVIAEDGVWLEDKGSSNGTWVDHARIRVKRVGLETGTRFWISKSVEIELIATGRVTVRASTSDAFGEMRGQSAIMREAFARLRKLARANLHVVLFGDLGTGKQLAARAIHEESGRRGAFIQLDPRALSDDRARSLLFGEGGMLGLFEQAHGGTLFLGELGDMSLDLQGHLLHAIETGEYCRVGETTIRRADVRVIAATRHNPKMLVATNNLREDLFFRLAESTVELPPLRRRPGDVAFLARFFVTKFARGSMELAPDAIRTLEGFPWEGNVMQLEAVIKRVVTLATDRVITAPQIEYGMTSLLRDPPLTGEELADMTWREAYEALRTVYFRAVILRHGLDYGRLETVTRMARRTLQLYVPRYRPR